MPIADVRGVQLCYETTGDPGGEPLVLIGGTGAQLIAWRPQLCDLLVAEGFFVIRFDNRDVGLSQKFGGRRDLDGGYELSDLGEDVIRVLDHLGLASAHLVGHSMGGMIAQVAAIAHPERVRSLVLLSTIPGRRPEYFPDGTGAVPELDKPQRRYPRALLVAGSVQLFRAGHRGSYPFDAAWAREGAALAYDRCYAPDGMARQWTALKRAPDRYEGLRTVTAPTLVLHGSDDPSILPRAAEDLAATIPGAEMRILPGVAHELPRELWREFVADVARTTARARQAG